VNHVKEQDPSLPEKLRSESAGILNWAIRGLLSYRRDGLIEPAIVQSETADYIKSLDIMAQFIEEECETSPSFAQPSGELYKRYRSWIEDRGQKALGSPRFKSELRAKGFRWDEDRAGNKFWYGIQLKGRV